MTNNYIVRKGKNTLRYLKSFPLDDHSEELWTTKIDDALVFKLSDIDIYNGRLNCHIAIEDDETLVQVDIKTKIVPSNE